METINLIINLFRFFCFMITCCMVGYWIHKYLKNEDATRIDYKLFQDTVSVPLPEATICFVDPILNDSLTSTNKSLNIEEYIEYLKGQNNLNQEYKKVDYKNVSLNLFGYLNFIWIGLRPGQSQSGTICTPSMPSSDSNNCSPVTITNNINGFGAQNLWKCLGIKIDDKYSKNVSYLVITFKEEFSFLLKQIPVVGVVFNHPGQNLRKTDTDQIIWIDPDENRTITSFKIDSMEILRRRDKPSDRCLTDYASYDQLILKHHIERIGCNPPYYQLLQNLPMCNTPTTLREFFNNGEKLPKGKIDFPCQEMPHLSFKYNNKMKPIDHMEWYPLHISYPENIKLVTQSQAIDAHALIGNIGGYIGLFLGKFFNPLYLS